MAVKTKNNFSKIFFEYQPILKIFCVLLVSVSTDKFPFLSTAAEIILSTAAGWRFFLVPISFKTSMPRVLIIFFLNFGLLFFFLEPFEIFSHYPICDIFYWFTEHVQLIIDKVFREEFMI